ncbi:MAG: hypothetical protein ABI274_07245 [Ktedonobacterales bacterium]
MAQMITSEPIATQRASRAMAISPGNLPCSSSWKSGKSALTPVFAALPATASPLASHYPTRYTLHSKHSIA